MNAELVRFATLSTCIIGKLSIGDNYFVTLELPWRDNKRGISCIPAGEYICRRVDSPRFGDTFEVCDVPGRSAILFHAGNSALKDTRGCILVGKELRGDCLLCSRIAMKEFLDITKAMNEFKLVITEEENDKAGRC